MLQPLSMALHAFTGWDFLRTADGDWESRDAGIVLVKACAGINFMTMSFIAWCLVLQPRLLRSPLLVHRERLLRECAWRLAAALLLAWLSALAVNTLRVIAVVHWQPQLQRWLAPEAAHRLIGIVIYLAALTLQLLPGEGRRWSRAAMHGALIYGAVMLILPMLSGNAVASPTQYVEHALAVLIVMVPLLAAALLSRYGTR
jgi:exosortase K